MVFDKNVLGICEEQTIWTIFIRCKVEDISMYLAESIQKVLVPKYYKSRDALVEDAFRALLILKPELKVEMAVELYPREEASLLRAAEIAGMNIESFRETVKARGLKVSSYIGSGENIELLYSVRMFIRYIGRR